MLIYMRIFAVYVAMLFILTPMIVHGAIENGMTLSDSEGVKIGEYEESTIVLGASFDEGFESVIFEIESSSESKIITVMLYNSIFGYPADLNEYFILADDEPIDARHEYGENSTEIEIEIEPGITSVEVFGKILDDNDAELIKKESENMTQVESTDPMPTTESENMTQVESTDPMPTTEIECDSNMVMENGQCVVVDEQPACDANTVFDGEKCVLESSNEMVKQDQMDASSENSDTLQLRDLIYGIAGGAIIALVISFFLVVISKISKKK